MNIELPEKVYFNVAIKYLDYTDLGLYEAIRTLCLLAMEDNSLSFYFDSDNHGFEASLEKDLVWSPFSDKKSSPPPFQLFDNKKKVKSPFYLLRKDDQFYCHNKQHDIETAQELHHEAVNNPQADIEIYNTYRGYMCTTCQENTCNSWLLKINYFEVNGTTYRAYSPNDKFIESLYIEHSNVYFLKDELLEFKNNQKNVKNQKPSNNDGPVISLKRPHGAPKKRLEVFKTWISVKAGLKAETKSELQKCYEAIGSPLIADLWKQLQKHDSNLFGFGDQKFFNDLRAKGLEFKLGRRKDKHDV